MALRDRLRALSARTQSDVLGLFERWQAGVISRDEFVAAAAAVIARANGRAVQFADRSAAIQLSRLLRTEVPVEPFDLGDQRSRIGDGLTTLLDEDPDIAEDRRELAESQRRRLSRMSRNEPLQRGQEAFQAALVASAVGWVRVTGPNACPLCEQWDDGEVRRATVRMPRHTGCSCVQRPARL